MHTAFDHTTGQWQIEWPGRVARHDLVYLSPPDDPLTGLLLGNGELGVLCYVSGSKLIFVINRSDLWDDGPPEAFNCAAAEEEERHTTLRHGGRVSIDFKVPLFELIYLTDFQARLSLADARIGLSAEGPFGAVSLDAFVSWHQDIFFCEIRQRLSDRTIPLEIRVERFGSRMFHRWYSQVHPDASLGLSGTAALARGQTGIVTHRLNSGHFALACRVVPVPDDAGVFQPEFKREGQNSATCCFAGEQADTFRLVCSLTEPVTDRDPGALAEEQISRALAEGREAIFTAHSLAWQSFWLRSLMECGDDFLDNLWHLVMYYSNCSQRGRYPGRFCGYLWNWQHDFQAWGFYFHFNQQQVYWPLPAAGHADLVRSYLNMRSNGLPHAKADAERFFGVSGAVVSDVADRRGFNSRSEFHNHTPVAQIAMTFWQQYQYTGDLSFLREQALPYLIAAAGFFAALFEKGEDGLYHARSGSGYEGGPLMRDVITELVTARVLFPTVLEALRAAGQDHPQRADWQDLADHLVPLQTIAQPPDVIAPENGQPVLQKGLLRGRPVPGNRIFAAGRSIGENRLMTSFSTVPDESASVHIHPMWILKGSLRKLVKKGPFTATYGQPDLAAFQYRPPDTNAYTDHIFPGVELSPVYPSGLIGLARQGTDQFDVAVTTAKLFANDMHGWVSYAAILARLGLSEELDFMLREIYATEPLQVNGTGVDSSGLAGEYAGPEAPLDLRSSLARYTTREGRFPNPTKNFRFMTLPSDLANGLNEMLLQSYDGVIRVAPAAGSRSARLTLHAVGGFVVSAEISKGRVCWVAVKSRLGGPCRLQNPWQEASVYQNGSAAGLFADPRIQIDTRPGDLLMVLPESGLYENWQTETNRCAPNQGPKHCPVGKNMLGLPRLF